jgi:uncharacterized protein
MRGLGWLALLLAAACAPEAERGGRRGPDAEPPPAFARVSVGMHVVRAEIADDALSRARGLSGRDGLPEGQGMAFLYPRADRYGFWMEGMRFDLDLVWIRDGRIVDITADVPHAAPAAGERPVYRPREPADTVLEVPAGTAARLGWRTGDAVLVEREAPGRDAR